MKARHDLLFSVDIDHPDVGADEIAFTTDFEGAQPELFALTEEAARMLEEALRARRLILAQRREGAEQTALLKPPQKSSITIARGYGQNRLDS